MDLTMSRDGVLAVDRAFELTAVGTNSQPDRIERHQIELWDVQRRTVTNTFPGQAPLCFSTNGRWFACQGSNPGTIQFRDMQRNGTWTSKGGFEISPDPNEFAFSPDGRFLASCGIETVLWETATGGRLATVVSVRRDLEPPIRTVVFTADSQWLIGGGLGGDIQVWNTATRQRNGRFHAHLMEITHLAVSPDGKTLASGGQVGRIILWRLEPPDPRLGSGLVIRKLLTLSEHHAAISDLRFSPKGDVLCSSDADGVVRLWRATPPP